MKTYIQPKIQVVELALQNVIADSLGLHKDKTTDQSWTREKNDRQSGVGGGLWSDMK